MDKKSKAPFFGESRRIFTAGMLANVMYLMVAAALASKFFVEFHPWLKIGMAIFTILFAVLSILMYPSVKKENRD